MPATTFDSTKEALSDLLRSVEKGTTQLPDFQRGWVWNDDQIRSLLASLTLSYPIGSVMLMQTGGTHVRFKPRPIEGVRDDVEAPDRLILDGQQRLTSLFQALQSDRPVQTETTRGKSIKRWYYLDIEKALDPHLDREEAIISVPEDKIVRSNFGRDVDANFSTREKECEAGVFPFSAIFNGKTMDWSMDYITTDDRREQWNTFWNDVVKRVDNYQIPLIVLRKDTPKEAVCQVFEKVNTGGVSLTVFELLTATFAADDFSLRDDWRQRQETLNDYRLLNRTGNDEFLQLVTLLATYDLRRRRIEDGAENLPGVSCKRKAILSLGLADYKKWADRAMQGMIDAIKLLRSQKFFRAKGVPYTTQIVPLAALLTLLEARGGDIGTRKKLVRWFWCGVFGEMYSSAVESRFAKDIVEVMSWLDGGEEPSTIQDANFVPTRLLSLRTRNSAAYKGLYALLLRDGGRDFRSGDTIEQQMYFDENIDIHHIFPRKWCKDHDIDRERYDSIINKTAISSRTNRQIGGRAPSTYLDRLENGAEIKEDEMNRILVSHAITPTYLRNDEFEAFFRDRANALLERIENAMDKPVARDAVEPEYASMFAVD